MTQAVWEEVVDCASKKEAAKKLAEFKSYAITRSNLVPCTVCDADDRHTMRYRIVACSSEACRRIYPKPENCPWRGRLMECSKDESTTIDQCSAHGSSEKDDKADKLTTQQKEFIKKKAADRLKPVRIRNAMVRELKTSYADLPPLAKVQSYSNYYRRTKLMNNDDYDEILGTIQKEAFTGAESDMKPFTFGARYDRAGKLVVGIGSDSEPFIVGISTKRLLARLDRPPETFVLHLDATYKLNQVGYPVLVVGVSDRSRSFHLVAVFVMSQQQRPHFVEALTSLVWVYENVMDKHLQLNFVMGDGDDAQFNACEEVFGGESSFAYLMCFYHVIAKVVEHSREMSDSVKAHIMRDVYDMHFSRSSQEFTLRRDQAMSDWAMIPEMKAFVQYFKGQWLCGKFVRWQCYHTSSGFATSNNPVEQFNRVLKRDYTLRTKLKMGTLLDLLLECCRHESGSDRPFRDYSEATPALKRRVR